jgi:copper(I)-binding protein
MPLSTMASKIHPMHRFSHVVVVVVALACANAAAAHDYTLQRLRVDHPFARATPPGARSGAVYLTIENGGSTADRLVRVASPAAASVELHTMTMDGNVMRMRAITGLDIAPGAKVTLGSSGYHVMLVGLAHPLAVGDKIPLTLTFEKAGSVDVSVFVEAMTTGAPAAAHGSHAP